MNESQQAAFVMSQVACALIEMEAMKAANTAHNLSGEPPKFQESDFRRLRGKYGLSHNTVIGLFKPDIARQV